jgi:Domain of unknown function (DUF5668)
MDRKQTSQMTTGLLLIVLGLMFLGQRPDLFPDIDLRRLWPMFLLVMGVGRLVAPAEGGRRSGGAWMVFLGVLFLLHTYRVLRLDDSWPLLIVAAGVSILFGRRNGLTAQRRADRRALGADPVQPGTEQTHGDTHGV